MKIILLAVMGASFGLLAAAGVFTVLAAVGLVPRFAGKTHTANKTILYENMVVLGTIAGTYVSVFSRYAQVAAFLQGLLPRSVGVILSIGVFFQICTGIFSGMFVGCLAIAIAEMLDSIPIFARRISFSRGIGFAILSMAAGKLCGSLFYFAKMIYLVTE